jgi:hypothetical protein
MKYSWFKCKENFGFLYLNLFFIFFYVVMTVLIFYIMMGMANMAIFYVMMSGRYIFGISFSTL